MHMGIGLVDFWGMGNLPEFIPLRNISISFLNFSFTLLFHFYCWFSYPFNWFIFLFATHFPLEALEWILLDVYSFRPLIIFYQKTKNSHVVFYLFQYLFSLVEEFWNIWGVLLSWFFLFLDFLCLICVSVGLDIFSDLEWQILLCCLLLTAQFLVPLSKMKTDTIIKKHQIIQNI